MDRTYRTRAQAGALAGRVPSAATGSDDENGRQSVSQLGGYAVEVTDAASPHETAHTELGDDESQYAETDDSRAVDLGTSDNPGRDVNPFGGGGRASAKAEAGVPTDATSGKVLGSSTSVPAGQNTPAHPSSGSRPRSNPNNGRPSIAASHIQAETPEAQHFGRDYRPDLAADAQWLASQMEPADAQGYLTFLRLEHQARIAGKDAMADAYMQKIVKIIDNLYTSGSGSSAGSSSGASVGMGASSVISEGTSVSSLPREIGDTIAREFASAMEAAATLYKGSISHGTSVSKVTKTILEVVKSLPSVYPPFGMEVAAELTLSSNIPDDWLVLAGHSGGVDYYGDALCRLQESVPAAPLDPNTHPFITQMRQYRTAYNDVNRRDPHKHKIDQLLRAFMLQLLAPAARHAVQTAGNSALLIDMLHKYLRSTDVDFMQREMRALGTAPPTLPAHGAFLVQASCEAAKAVYAHRMDKLQNQLHMRQEDLQLGLVMQAFPQGVQGTPLATALSEVKTRIMARLLQSDTGRGHAENLRYFDELIQAYSNKQYPGELLTEENNGAAVY